MTLRDQLLSSPETLSDLAWAAEQRFRDAEEVLFSGRPPGAIYLLGLSAEMWLKLACGKFLGLSPAAPVAGLLGPARTWIKNQPAPVPHESYHGLLFCAEYLVRRRAADGPPLAAPLTGELRHHVMQRLFEDWKIEIRYRLVALSESRAWRVYNDSIWLRQNWERLWR